VTFTDLSEFYDTVNGRVNCKVLADKGTWASNFGATSLTNEDFTCAYFLATKTLNAKALTGIVVDILA
jgi:hypothetical protein